VVKVGLIINPLAGIGGPLGLKGSDGAEIVNQAKQQGALLRAANRAALALTEIQSLQHLVTLYCFDGEMGAETVSELGFNVEVIGSPSKTESGHSCAEDTRLAAKVIRNHDVDLLVFVGGDGTARDIFEAVGSDFPVLGIPSGVKMHSGVYAVSPQAAGELLKRFVRGQLVDISLAEVRDIDEVAFRQNIVKTRFYGELLVPREGHFLQQVKSSGREVEALVVQDIAADVVESMETDCLYLIGPGSTPAAIMDELSLENTLLGIDAVYNEQLLGQDLNEQQILALLADYNDTAKIVITAIGGQGHILGRGNQQLSPAVIRQVGAENIIVVATKTKITELNGRPLLVDTNDVELDVLLRGYRSVVTGYHDAIIYPVGVVE
jgi:predicted polyphosphate/ATP-dependent NAD kinase